MVRRRKLSLTEDGGQEWRQEDACIGSSIEGAKNRLTHKEKL